MLAAMSVTSLCLGVTLAGYAPHAGKRTSLFETFGGAFFMGGLVLLGTCLPFFR